jgi:hypothetical protein
MNKTNNLGGQIMKYFKVTAKCGHVGKNWYYRGMFYVCAKDGKTAAAIVREKPRVKHDHKDAIIAVEKIDYLEFEHGTALQRLNPYFNCGNNQEQRQFIDELEEDIYRETYGDADERRGNSDRKAKRKAIEKLYRKMDKYGDYKMGA